jgi:hypothetical protein
VEKSQIHCEPKISDLWKRTELAESLISMSIAKAFSPAQSISPQDWYLKAIYYRLEPRNYSIGKIKWSNIKGL